MSGDDLVYRSAVTVEAMAGRAKRVTLPVDGITALMGVNNEVARHYRMPAGSYTPHATTLDYIVGATAACLTGTFGGALEAIGQPIHDGELTAEAEGEVGLDGRIMVLRRISVHYRLRRAEGVSEEAVAKAHDSHVARCPVARSLGSAISIRTDLSLG